MAWASTRRLCVAVVVGACAALVARAPLSRRGGRLWTRRGHGRPSLVVVMLRDRFDLVVIGGGPVGVSACLRAASLGRSSILIDATPPRQFQFTGPTGLFSKALRDAALRLDVPVLRSMGLGDAAIWAQVRELVDRIVRKCGDDNAQALQLSRVPHLRGRGSIGAVSEDGVEVDVAFEGRVEVQRLHAGRCLVATGSRALRLPCLDAEGVYDVEGATCHGGHVRFYDSDSIKRLSFLPRRVVVVGGGIIAVEFANIFAALDADVTLVVRAKSLASSLGRVGIDEGLAEALQQDLVRQGVTLRFETEVVGVRDFRRADLKKINRNPKRATAQGTFQDLFHVDLARSSSSSSGTGVGAAYDSVEADLVLTATGRKAATGSLGLDAPGENATKKPSLSGAFPEGALAPNGDIRVGPDLSLPGAPTVSAAGDVVGAPQLASTGVAQAEAAVDAMFAAGLSSDASKTTTTSTTTEGTRSFSPEALLAKNAARYPIGIWTVPELAFVGLTRKAAAAQGLDVVVGEAFYTDTIRGSVSSAAAAAIPIGGSGNNNNKNKRGGPRLKLVVSRAAPQVVLGVHIFGNDAAELIHFGTTLVQGEKTLDDVLALCFAAVTYHELYKLAARNALEQVQADAWRTLHDALANDDEDGCDADPRLVLRADVAAKLATVRETDATEDILRTLFASAADVDADLFVTRAMRLQPSSQRALRAATMAPAPSTTINPLTSFLEALKGNS